MKIKNINKLIGDRIKIARVSRNLSQDSIADDLGISVSAYSNMERGVVDITVNRLVQVAEILKVDWTYLLGIEKEEEKNYEKYLQKLSGPTAPSYTVKQSTQTDIENDIKLLKQEITKLKKRKRL
jgi:transcriptional regulator with XRE-family HTH domain